jgi:hypothetical protein
MSDQDSIVNIPQHSGRPGSVAMRYVRKISQFQIHPNYGSGSALTTFYVAIISLVFFFLKLAIF